MVTTVTDFDNGATTRDVLGRLINLLCTRVRQFEGKKHGFQHKPPVTASVLAASKKKSCGGTFWQFHTHIDNGFYGGNVAACT